MLQGTILVLALFFVALNLLVDLVQTALDPRIKRMSNALPQSFTAVQAELSVQAAPAARRRRGYWGGVGRRLSRDPATLFCVGVLLLMLGAIMLAPLVAPFDPYQAPVLVSLGIGGVLGVAAGYAGGWVNMAIMRAPDVFYAFPSVLLAVAISGALGAGIYNAILSLSLVFIPQIIRVAETVATGIRNLDYVESARASGAGAAVIVRVHVLPNVLGPIFVYATSLISVSMILAAGLSFLGLGTKPPEAEWGLMLNTLRSAMDIRS